MANLIIVFTALLFSQFTYATECVAHRGNNKAELENSLASINSALDVGARVIEFDIMHSSDGKGILMHDKTFKRTAKCNDEVECDTKQKVKELTLDEIHENYQLKNGEAVPELMDGLNAVAGRSGLFLEFKDTPSKETLNQVWDVFHARPEDLTIISFKKKALQKVRAHERLSSLLDQGTKLLHLSSPFKKIEKNFDGVGFYKPSKWKVKRYKKRGLIVAAYTINKRKKIKKYIKQGIDYVISDDPALCLRLLENH